MLAAHSFVVDVVSVLGYPQNRFNLEKMNREDEEPCLRTLRTQWGTPSKRKKESSKIESRRQAISTLKEYSTVQIRLWRTPQSLEPNAAGKPSPPTELPKRRAIRKTRYRRSASRLSRVSPYRIQRSQDKNESLLTGYHSQNHSAYSCG